MDSSTHGKSGAEHPKLALFGAFGVGNLGNECTLQSLLHNIRKHLPNSEIRCICPGPDQVHTAYGIPAVPIEHIPLPYVSNPVLRILRKIFLRIPIELFRCIRAIATLAHVDMLVMTGTGMLGDFGISPLDLHFQILKWTLLAKLCRCRVAFLSVGAGPLRQPLSRRIVKAALWLADYRSYRDSFSRNYLEIIKFDTQRDHVFPDLAFSFPVPMLPPAPNDGRRRPVVGVGLMTYYNRTGSPSKDDRMYLEYISKMGDFVAWLLAKKYSVRLLIGDVAYDQPATRDLMADLRKRGVHGEDGAILDDPAVSVDQVLSQLASTDFVVASRFHNILLALMLAKPVLAISYHEKNAALMASAGLADFTQDIEQIDVNKMIQQFEALGKNAERIRLQLQRNAIACRAALDEQYHLLFKDQLACKDAAAMATLRQQGTR
ncbi:MAG: polysaccharide pyruvyl transferase family protein [Candidatus Acidiferrales bacterium]